MSDFKFSQLGAVIMSSIFLIIMLVFMVSFFSESEYVAAKQQCSLLFSQASSSTIFFEDNYNFKESFFKAFSQTCVSYTMEVEKDEVYSAANDGIKSCWEMTRGDSDYLPSAYRGGVCVYCGDITLKNYEYNEFRGDLSKELQGEKYSSLFETSSSTSLNSLLLNPSTFSVKEDTFGVIAYAYKGKFTSMEELSNSGISFLSNGASLLGAEGIVNEFFDKSVGTFKKTQKGIAFVDYTSQGPRVNGKTLDEAFECEVMVPINSTSVE